jgi:hypothetical protein
MPSPPSLSTAIALPSFQNFTHFVIERRCRPASAACSATILHSSKSRFDYERFAEGRVVKQSRSAPARSRTSTAWMI